MTGHMSVAHWLQWKPLILSNLCTWILKIVIIIIIIIIIIKKKVTSTSVIKTSMIFLFILFYHLQCYCLK